ncbi:MAG: FHA domain-containing protein [Prevotella sp.]|nr:FHA domain-containing protein [Prevotella sp.]
MEILVGKGGNQSMPITDETVSRIHCKIEVLDSGHIAVTNLSAAGTFINGLRLVKRTLVNRDAQLQLGPRFTATVRELIESEDYAAYTCHQVVRRKYQSSSALQVFLSTSAQRVSDKLTRYAIPVAKSAQAYYLIDEGKYWEAQNLIYEAGDTLYDMQDGSDLLQGIYATMLVVCARLYLEVGRMDTGLEAIKGAISIFDRLPSDCLGNSVKQREEANKILSMINERMGNN